MSLLAAATFAARVNLDGLCRCYLEASAAPNSVESPEGQNRPTPFRLICRSDRLYLCGIGGDGPRCVVDAPGSNCPAHRNRITCRQLESCRRFFKWVLSVSADNSLPQIANGATIRALTCRGYLE